MKFYRYDIDYFKDTPQVQLLEYVLESETPKGYWIRPLLGGMYFSTWRKWISKTSRKRFAYPTKEEALNSFIIRKEKQVRYCKNDLYYAEETLKIAKKLKENGQFTEA